MRKKILLLIGALLALALGAFVTGFGLKFSWWWRMTMPNFADGIATVVAGLLIMGVAIWYAFSLLPIGNFEEEE